jgi:RNA polymerase sigma-70 factor (ECF subfamily)
LTQTVHADPDRRLVADAAAGDRDAFDALVRRHQARTYNFVRAMVHDESVAEDLTQDVFVRVWKSIGRFRGDSAFSTWLFRIAVNVARTHLSRRSRWRLFSRPSSDASPDAPVEVEDPPSPERLEDDVVRRDAIDRALATLSPDLREAVTLRDVEGLDYREIARVLDIPLGTVESRIFRARQRLRPLLAPLVGSAPAREAPAAAGMKKEG